MLENRHSRRVRRKEGSKLGVKEKETVAGENLAVDGFIDTEKSFYFDQEAFTYRILRHMIS